MLVENEIHSKLVLESLPKKRPLLEMPDINMKDVKTLVEVIILLLKEKKKQKKLSFLGNIQSDNQDSQQSS